MVEKIDEVVKAKAQIVQGALVIWNTRLELLRNAGDLQSLIDHMVTPIEAGFFDNCSCNHGCKPMQLEEMIGKPAARVARK